MVSPRIVSSIRIGLSAALVATLAIPAAMSLLHGVEHGFVGSGYVRSLVFELAWQLRRWGPWAFAIGFVAGTLAAAAGPRRRRLPGWIGASAALALTCIVGWPLHRYEFAPLWRARRQLGSLSLPAAPFEGEVWLRSLLVVALGVAVGLLAYGAARRASGSKLEAAIHGLGRPVVGAVLVALLVSIPFGAQLLREHAGHGPNVVVVSLDTLRADRLGVYGCERPTSPHIDALARESVLFEWAIAPAPNTPLSHMSLFTSLYPSQHGFRGNGDRLAAGTFTLAEHLRERGYRNWASTDGGYMRGWTGFADGFEHYDDEPKGIGAAIEGFLHWLDARTSHTPFFVFLHGYDVHTPYDPPPPHRGLFADPDYDGRVETTSRALEQIRRSVHRDPQAGHGLRPEDVAHLLARYDEGVHYADRRIGDLMQGLRSRGRLQDTWVVLLSDHGEEFTEHGSVLHEKLYHTVTHVPLVMRPPDGEGRVRPGRRVAEVVELLDVLPTVLEWAGIDPPSNLEGRSLGPLLRGESATGWKNRAFGEFPWSGGGRALTSARWHLVMDLQSRATEAFDYRVDRLEQSAWSGEDAATVEALRIALMRWSDGTTRTAIDDGPSELDPTTEAQLRALGYVD